MSTIRQVLQYIASRLTEPSTQVSVGAAFGLLGLNIGDSEISLVLNAISGIALAAGFITPESSSPPSRTS
jgi:hypothetical protein